MLYLCFRKFHVRLKKKWERDTQLIVNKKKSRRFFSHSQETQGVFTLVLPGPLSTTSGPPPRIVQTGVKQAKMRGHKWTLVQLTYSVNANYPTRNWFPFSVLANQWAGISSSSFFFSSWSAVILGNIAQMYCTQYFSLLASGTFRKIKASQLFVKH